MFFKKKTSDVRTTKELQAERDRLESLEQRQRERAQLKSDIEARKKRIAQTERQNSTVGKIFSGGVNLLKKGASGVQQISNQSQKAYNNYQSNIKPKPVKRQTNIKPKPVKRQTRQNKSVKRKGKPKKSMRMKDPMMTDPMGINFRI